MKKIKFYPECRKCDSNGDVLECAVNSSIHNACPHFKSNKESTK